MRYIGSKSKVLSFINETIQETTGEIEGKVIADLFAGTACVGEYFKKNQARVISNDYMQYSYALQMAKIGINTEPNCYYTYNQALQLLNNLKGIEGFFYKEYSLNGTANAKYQRNYFSQENAMKIDEIRKQLADWYSNELIDMQMYQLINASLVDAITRVSNTSGTYGAFLKVDDNRKYKELTLVPIELYDNGMANQCYCDDIFNVINEIKGDILYLDPPYNSRQYPPYYHILESAVSNETPSIYGKTGRRYYNDKLSPFCIKAQALPAMSNLVKTADFEDIYISYSTEGLIPHAELCKELSQYGETNIFFKNYRRYKSNGGDITLDNKLKELIIHVRKRKRP